MRMRRAAAAAVVLGFVMAAAGCSVHPGAAAVVDGHEISEAYLQGAYEDFAELGEATPQQLLGVLVAMRATDDVVEEQGISVSGADALAALNDRGIDTSGFSAGGVQIARYLAIYEAAQARQDVADIEAAMDAARRAADIVINPRYGSFDAEAGSVVAGTPPTWMVTEDSTPAPAAK